MRILFAGDEQPYSEYALKETIRLAANTWADVTLLGIHSAGSVKDLRRGGTSLSELPVSTALRKYRDIFLNSWAKDDSPYEMQEGQYEWIPLKEGRFEETRVLRSRRKDFRVRMRIGNPGTEILAEAAEDESDLIILGAAKGENCQWIGSNPAPRQILDDADCSVLLVKEEQPVNRILACLDQGYISQESLEMINQMVTIHDAQLELIGLSESGSINVDAFSKLSHLGEYYSDRDISVRTRLTEVSEFENIISGELRQDLLALWVGKKSLLRKFFSRGWVGRFVSKSQTSVLVMR